LGNIRMNPYYKTDLGALYCGDCFALINAISVVDFVFADPPYGIGKAQWDGSYIGGFEQEILKLSTRGCAITPGQENIGACIQNMGNYYRGILCARNLNGMTFSKVGFENWIPTVLGGKIKRGPNYLEFAVRGDKPDHPCPKPISYIIQIVSRFTETGDTVLDPFLGSGTTAVACEQLNRRWIGIEISEKYCEIAAKRIERERQQLKLFQPEPPKQKPEQKSLFKVKP
jgi:DNA modification methylase